VLNFRAIKNESIPELIS